ncbi:hypothetical protein [Neisseria mucosa]|uniref:hypothetical protein n=1 Tax=Neisseria mucosa TaxID=488 RepID=UPI0018CE5F95
MPTAHTLQTGFVGLQVGCVPKARTRLQATACCAAQPGTKRPDALTTRWQG